MSDRSTAFVGSIPENYDRYLGPLFFHPCADDLVTRLVRTPGIRVLETACGTGIVTERLARVLAPDGTLVATDLNEPMLAYAQQRTKLGAHVAWRTADATALPFDTASFDAVVCQFGLMFYPDKALGVREARRVLKPGGQYLLNVWDTLERHPATLITHETVASFFPADPPQFFRIPHSLADPEPVKAWLREEGFPQVDVSVVEGTGTSPTAADAARAMIEGTPLYGAIMQRGPDLIPEIEAAVATKVAAQLGDRPVRAPLRWLVFSARAAQ